MAGLDRAGRDRRRRRSRRIGRRMSRDDRGRRPAEPQPEEPPPPTTFGLAAAARGQPVVRHGARRSFSRLVVGGVLIALTDSRTTHASVLLLLPMGHLHRGVGVDLATATRRCSRVRSSTRSTPSSGTLHGDHVAALGDPGHRDAADPRRTVGRARVPGRAVQHRWPGPDHHGRDLRRIRRLRLAPADRHPPDRRVDRRHARRRALGRPGGLAQGANRRARGHHHDHAQLRRAVPAGVPARRQRLPATAVRTRPSPRWSTPNARLPHLLGSDLRLHAGLLVAVAAAAACPGC